MIGESAGRKEDLPLLTGRARFIDDIARPGMLHMGVVRSPHAHARIVRVAGGFAAADLPEAARPIPPYKAKQKFRAYEQPVLARAIVRYVGEPVAVVVADDARLLAEAVEAVEVDYQPLPAVASTDAALRPGAARVHEQWPDNVAYVGRVAIGDVDAAMGKAHLVVEESLRHPRLAAMPIETRGALAYADDGGRLTVVSTTQHPYHLREVLAHILGLAEEEVRVVTPDVGGSFGAKGQIHGEDILVAALARRLGRPVKWIETRSEHFIATCHDREQHHEVRAGFAADGTLVAIDDRFAADFGAYAVQEDGVTVNTINHLCGPYRVPNYRNACTNVVTHKTFSAAYRAAGRPEAAFVMERVLDIAARRLGIDPADLRRRNLVAASAMPYRPGLTYKDGVPVAYDPADFPAAFDKLLALFGYQEMRARQKRTKHMGIGLACYVQGTALGPYEGANVRVDASGKVYVYVGLSSQGQSHATTLAQVCAQELGVAYEDVTIVGGDTQALPYGFGPYGSRIAANAGPAVARAAREVRAKAIRVASSLLEAAEADIRITAGRAHVVGVPGHGVALSALAVKAKALKPEPGLNACVYFNPETVTWAFGAHAAAVEVDVETCEVRILKYAAVHDCGKAINPMVVDGQLHGGIAQGIGAALMEELVYDDSGQLQTGSFMDYAMPKAADLPSILTAQLEYPSAINELGIKGVGESGAIAPGAALANAVEDALAGFGITIRELPVTPARLFALLRFKAARP
ncbi:MAG TPA: xanthine dehydrogenase family protein molybdopterin-binding subunit [Burkholderiales bacterium]|nr:xanthine dehydrogenase family protein molybdopterin-binding subunit [Burkholderiales bacterium]